MPRTTRRIGSTVFLIATLGLAGPALAAPIQIVSLDRDLTEYYYDDGGYRTDTVHNPPDDGPWDLSLTRRHQTSSVEGTRVDVDLFAAGGANDDFEVWARYSRFNLVFDLGSATTFRLTGELTASTGSPSDQSQSLIALRVSDPEGPFLDAVLGMYRIVLIYVSDAQLALDETVELEPGRYQLYAEAEGDGVELLGSGRGSVDISFVQVPEPSTGLLLALAVAMLATGAGRP